MISVWSLTDASGTEPVRFFVVSNVAGAAEKDRKGVKVRVDVILVGHAFETTTSKVEYRRKLVRQCYERAR